VEFKDYYKIMGVARNATEAEIKQAYRKLARKYHPDVSKEKDAESRFKEVGEAYEVLKSPEKRAAYDQLGSGPRPGQEFRPPPDWGTGFEFSGAGPHAGGGHQDYSDFFEALFGAERSGAGRRARGGFDTGRGEDHHAKVMLDLEAALHGGPRTFTLRVPEIDSEGHVVARERVLNVQVPKGILEGQTIRLAGQGGRPYGEGGHGRAADGRPDAQGSAGQALPGDLYIEVEFQPHPLYRIDGRDLYLQLPVAPWEAALGATVKTPTPAGTVDLKIPAGSHSGGKLRLKGRGMPSSPPGDLYAVLEIALPPATTDQAKAAYRALAEVASFNPRASLGV
jgi:curved DNA-binding protein